MLLAEAQRYLPATDSPSAGTKIYGTSICAEYRVDDYQFQLASKPTLRSDL